MTEDYIDGIIDEALEKMDDRRKEEKYIIAQIKTSVKKLRGKKWVRDLYVNQLIEKSEYGREKYTPDDLHLMIGSVKKMKDGTYSSKGFAGAKCLVNKEIEILNSEIKSIKQEVMKEKDEGRASDLVRTIQSLEKRKGEYLQFIRDLDSLMKHMKILRDAKIQEELITERIREKIRLRLPQRIEKLEAELEKDPKNTELLLERFRLIRWIYEVYESKNPKYLMFVDNAMGDFIYGKYLGSCMSYRQFLDEIIKSPTISMEEEIMLLYPIIKELVYECVREELEPKVGIRLIDSFSI